MIRKVNIYVIMEAVESDTLFAEYFEEGKTQLLHEFKVNKETYYNLATMKMLDAYGVFDEDKLVGFIIASTSESPHYSTLVTTIMSFFVSKKYRKFGTAKDLLANIEADAIKKGSKTLIISSPYEAVLGKFVSKIGFKPTHILYGKDLK